MPMIEVPLKPWTEYAELRKLKKFKPLADEGLALTYLSKLVKTRREELSADLHDRLEGRLPEGVKTVKASANITKSGLLALLRDLIPDEIEIKDATISDRAEGESSRFNKKQLMQVPIPCVKCGADNHVTPDVVELCTKRGTRRAGVSIKLAGEEEE